MRIAIALTLLGIFMFSSCKQGEKKDVLVERIQYDVFIKSPEPDLDWWVQNIEGARREEFIKKILDAAYSGKYKVYDCSNSPLTKEQVKNIGFKVDSLTFQRSYPPYEYFDTVVVHRLNPNDIVKIRFLEEWYTSSNGSLIDKKIVGLSPMIKNFDETGEFRGYQCLFWVYFSDKYPINK